VRVKWLAWILPVFFLLFISVATPTAQIRTTPPQRVDGSPDNSQPDENRDQMEKDRAKKANLERQAQLKSDTDKLVKLAGELKEYVDKSNENMLSLDVMKKAEEIEKLAKSVKEKMRGQN
jgi:hypothetical protein